MLCRFMDSLKGIQIENLRTRWKAVPLSETNYSLLQINPGLLIGHSRDCTHEFSETWDAQYQAIGSNGNNNTKEVQGICENTNHLSHSKAHVSRVRTSIALALFPQLVSMTSMRIPYGQLIKEEKKKIIEVIYKYFLYSLI